MRVGPWLVGGERDVAVYLFPEETYLSLKEDLDAASADLTFHVKSAKSFVFAVLFDEDEKREFGNDGASPHVLATPSAADFERIFPEFKDGKRQYVAVSATKVRKRLDPYFVEDGKNSPNK